MRSLHKINIRGNPESKDTNPVKMQGILFSEMAVLPCEIGTV
jgi:hypothetical protein